MYGLGVCNRTGRLTDELANAWRLWNFNRTREWIDEIFGSTYRSAARGFRALTVAAEEGLSAQELVALGLNATVEPSTSAQGAQHGVLR